MDEDHVTIRIEELERLREENEKLKDDVSLLLQDSNRASEASIRRDYTELCDAIDVWVDDVTAASNKDDFRKHYRDRVRERGQGSGLRKQGLSTDWIQRLGSYEGAECFILAFKIQNELAKHIFDHSYPIGTNSSQRGVLDGIQKGMRSSRLERDQIKVDKWRSETVTALTNLPTFRQRQMEKRDHMIASAKKAIYPWIIDRNAYKKHESRLSSEIFDSAIRLHQTMKTSTCRYTMVSKLRPGMISDHAAPVTLRDIATWGKVRNNTEVKDVVCCLYQAIARHGRGNEEDTEIVKPVVVVSLTWPPHHRRASVALDSPVESRRTDDNDEERGSDSRTSISSSSQRDDGQDVDKHSSRPSLKARSEHGSFFKATIGGLQHIGSSLGGTSVRESSRASPTTRSYRRPSLTHPRGPRRSFSAPPESPP